MMAKTLSAPSMVSFPSQQRSDWKRLPSSKAACSTAALVLPSPGSLVSCSTDMADSLVRELSAPPSSVLESSITFIPEVPLLSSTASSSELLRAPAPLPSIFSTGRSSKPISFIFMGARYDEIAVSQWKETAK